MIYLAYIVLAFTSVQLLVSISNLLFREKLKRGRVDGLPLVSVLIPARNEEKNISNILKDLLNQEYEYIEIIVFNDQSDDKTPEIVQSFIEKDNRIRLINSEGLPTGWLGKNHACHCLSRSAKGDYLLFLDSDVRVSNGIITNSVTFAIHNNLALISIFPKQILETFGEKFTVPNMNYILLSLLPLVLVRKLSFPSLAAANGQFMLFNSSIYKSFKLHEMLKSNKVEDIEIARFLKGKKQRIACLTGDKSIRCRMYSGFKDAVNGFSKNISSFFANSIIIALLFWITTTFGFIPVYMTMTVNLFILYLVAYLMVRVLISVSSEQNVYFNLLYFIPQQLSCGIFIYKAFLNRYIKDYQWKGRNVK
jgi:hypothetical protein